MTYTTKELDDLSHRLTKGWVIHPVQIRTLIDMARRLIEMREGANAKPAQPQTAQAPFAWCSRCHLGQQCTNRFCPNQPPLHTPPPPNKPTP